MATLIAALKKKINQYGYIGIVRLTLDLIRTKLLFKNARLVRFPIDIRGKDYIEMGKGFTSGRYCRIEAYPADEKSKVLFVGENVQINDFVHITAVSDVYIGNNVLMASKIYISDTNHGSYTGNEFDSNPKTSPSTRALSSKKVKIEENVWLGEFVSVLPGVTIGRGTIVGSGSVVSRDLPPDVIAVGSPAKPIKKFNHKLNRWEKIF